jgi:dephospho-CoA kinase
MYTIGLTGQIASGKSTVAHYFSKLGAAIISADQISKELTQPNQKAFHDIISYFGTSVLTSTGELDRQQLRQFIFHETKHRLWLEALLHPLIKERIVEKIHQLDRRTDPIVLSAEKPPFHPEKDPSSHGALEISSVSKEHHHRMNEIAPAYCVIEIPLLKSKASHPYLHRILLIETTPEQQMARFAARDHGSKDELLAMMAAQVDIKKLQQLADNIIINTGSLTELFENVTLLDTQYRQQAKSTQRHHHPSEDH